SRAERDEARSGRERAGAGRSSLPSASEEVPERDDRDERDAVLQVLVGLVLDVDRLPGGVRAGGGAVLDREAPAEIEAGEEPAVLDPPATDDGADEVARDLGGAGAYAVGGGGLDAVVAEHAAEEEGLAPGVDAGGDVPHVVLHGDVVDGDLRDEAVVERNA